jgi:MFS family permease
MAPAKIFYGWWVVLAFSVMVFLSSGLRFTVGPFLKPVVTDLGLDRGSFSLVVSLSLFLFGAFMPLVGRLVDRFGSRLVVCGGSLVLAGALVATGHSTNLWHLFLFYGILVALGLSATGQVVASAIIARWFATRRGTAVSVLSGASAAGMTFLVPLVMSLILAYGWRRTYELLGLFVLLLILPLGLWVVRDRPEAMGLLPDGESPSREAEKDVTESVERTRLAAAIQNRSFWQLTGGLFACGFSMTLLSAHGVPMLTDHGFHPMVAASALGFLGGAAMIGSVVLGLLSDRFGRRSMLALVYVLRVLAFTMLFFVRDSVTLTAVAAIGGFGMSGSMAMTAALTGDLFGRFSVGSIMGMIFLSHQTGAALGSWLGGFLFDLSGGYGLAFAVACSLLLVGATLSITIDDRIRRIPSPMVAHPMPAGFD